MDLDDGFGSKKVATEIEISIDLEREIIGMNICCRIVRWRGKHMLKKRTMKKKIMMNTGLR